MIDPNRYREREKPDRCDKCLKKAELSEYPYLFMEDGKYEKKWVCKPCMERDKSFEKIRKDPNYGEGRFPNEIGFKYYPQV